MNKNIFDLDMQVNKINGAQNAPQRLTSVSLCTPGSCNNTCKTGTFASNCCEGTTVTTVTSATGTNPLPTIATIKTIKFTKSQQTC